MRPRTGSTMSEGRMLVALRNQINPTGLTGLNRTPTRPVPASGDSAAYSYLGYDDVTGNRSLPFAAQLQDSISATIRDLEGTCQIHKMGPPFSASCSGRNCVT